MINGPEIYTNDLSEQLIATGDLFFPVDAFGRSDCGGVVLTPVCDLAHQKIQWVKLAKATLFRTYLIEEFIPMQLKDVKEFSEQISQDPTAFGITFLCDKNSRVNRHILRLVKNLKRVLENVSPFKSSHYYLPGKDKPIEGYLVDFSHITSVPYQDLKAQRLVSRLKSPWREQLLNRYIGFSLRIGTEDYSEESIVNTIHSFFPDVPKDDILKVMKK